MQQKHGACGSRKGHAQNARRQYELTFSTTARIMPPESREARSELGAGRTI